jgi:uncharacterized membrane protein (UPF0136 family)
MTSEIDDDLVRLLAVGGLGWLIVRSIKTALGVTYDQLAALAGLGLAGGVSYGLIVGGVVWWMSNNGRESLIAGAVTGIGTVGAGWFIWDGTSLSMELSYAIGGAATIAGLIAATIAVIAVAVWWDGRKQKKSESRSSTSANSEKRARARRMKEGLNQRQRQRQRQQRYQAHVPKTTGESEERYETVRSSRNKR